MLALLSAASVALAQTPLPPRIEFTYTSLAGQSVHIDSTNRQITFDSNLNDEAFQIVTSNQVGLAGLRGAIDGSFFIGTVTSGPGPVETATVSGSGIFKLFEPGSNTVALTADLNWNDTLTYGSQGVLNATAGINMTNFAYAGTYAPLAAFLAGSDTGVSILTFQFIPGRSLTWLTTPGNGNNSASYSASVETNAPVVAIPEPTTYAAILAGAVLFGVMIRRRSGSVAP